MRSDCPLGDNSGHLGSALIAILAVSNLCSRLTVAKAMLVSRSLGVAIRPRLSSQLLCLVLIIIAHFPQALLCGAVPHQVGLRMEQLRESK